MKHPRLIHHPQAIRQTQKPSPPLSRGRWRHLSLPPRCQLWYDWDAATSWTLPNQSAEPRRRTESVKDEAGAFTFAFPAAVFSSEASDPSIILFFYYHDYYYFPPSLSPRSCHVMFIKRKSIFRALPEPQIDWGHVRKYETFPFSANYLPGVWKAV